MPRIARIVIPHYLHHVTQRGNRRQKVFLMMRVFVESGEWRVARISFIKAQPSISSYL